MKKLISLFALAVVLTTLLAVPAQAATTYPTATLISAPSSIRRGNTGVFKFTLRSGSYNRSSKGIWRAEIDVRIYNGSGRKVASNGSNGTWYSGTQNHNFTFKFPTSLVPGRYSINYRTYYNKYTGKYKWYYNKYTTNKWYDFTVY